MDTLLLVLVLKSQNQIQDITKKKIYISMKFDSIHGGNHHSICTMHSAKQDFSTSEIILMQCLPIF